MENNFRISEDEIIEERKKYEENYKKLEHSRARHRTKNVVIAILLATTIFGAYQYNTAMRLRQQLNNAYNKAFYELVDYIKNVEVMLMKARMTSSPELTAATLSDVWRESFCAASNLGQLPISVGVLSNTEKFLTQVADLSKSMVKQSTNGKPIDEEQMKTLASLHSFSVNLEKGLLEMQQDLSNGNLRWENVANEGQKEMKEISENLPKTFSGINDQFEEMPTLIYDGPYSEHMQNRKALGLTGEKITENQAIERLKKFLGDGKVQNVSKLADNNNGIINTYNFKMELANKEKDSVAEADVSVIGGHVVWYLYNREVGEKTIDINKAMQLGKKFLEERNYPNMKESYYMQNDGVATINYAYTEDGITYYPDLIKVKVALDNGEIVGFEANGYLMNHTQRDFGPPKLTEAQARERVIRGENIKSSGLAVIPTNYGTEILCYEFTGKVEDKDFLVYINANTGAEEEVLIIINSEEGILTM
ncbi:MAG TPA: germination protein YpeB [Clostridiaceae bacterium]|jgi:spore germination protein|nr:germination protein YpeB [Clostridiaceae bacterium]